MQATVTLVKHCMLNASALTKHIPSV